MMGSEKMMNQTSLKQKNEIETNEPFVKVQGIPARESRRRLKLGDHLRSPFVERSVNTNVAMKY